MTLDEFVPKFSTAGNYRLLKHRGDLTVVSAEGGVYIEYAHPMPKKYRDAIYKEMGDPAKYIAMEPLRALVKRNDVARMELAEYEFVNACGKKQNLPLEYQLKYGRQCDWLDVISRCLANKQWVKESFGISICEFWDNISLIINNDEEAHGLPTAVKRLMATYKQYREEGGWRALVAKDVHRFGNDRARKVAPETEKLMVALKRIKFKPTKAEVHRFYLEFMHGTREVVDLDTGEVFKPADFDNKGKATELSVETVKNYLNKPVNVATVDASAMGAKDFNDAHRPYMLRDSPIWAFSKCTMDDTASPFKMMNGDRPATYKFFDVASTALVHMVMHKEKRPDTGLIRQLLAGVIVLIMQKGWKMPFEVEVERALTSDMTGDGVNMDVLSAGAVFPFIRWCKAKNPQEKRAEGFIKQLKYHYHRHREGFQYRPFNRLTENRERDGAPMFMRKDEEAKDFKEATYTFEDIYQMELDDMWEYNNAPHPNQDKYPGKTRWQVLEEFQNPNLPLPNLSQIIPYVGTKVKTSVDRLFVQVQYKKYKLPDVALLGALSEPEVVAYWLPDENGEIRSVYLYQDGKFICEAQQVARFQEAKAEQTADDHLKLGRQEKYIKDFDQLIQGRIDNGLKVGVMPPAPKGEYVAVKPLSRVAEVVGVENEEYLPEPVYVPGTGSRANSMI